ncbi:MAG TPA: nucleoside triphosphate pyrophosphohydrolase [Candidatus Acidoferrum sp.]|jgi:MazG family protein|nr:nucleoside triphosphate pyrophosphohydrolase [Candidatus Acidoferrum sp.]
MPRRLKNYAPGSKRRIARQPRQSRKKLTPGQWFEKLVAVQARLRARNGCPWDRDQTHQTLRTYLIEEAYEVLEALEGGDDAKFAEELGDLLLQIVFHAQIAREERRFTISDVIREIHDKMVRRHPHVFGGARVKNSAEVLKNWEGIKAEERRRKTGAFSSPGAETSPPSLLDGISRGLPAVLEGFQLTRRAARIGFDWNSALEVAEKVREELDELTAVAAAKANSADRDLAEEEVGDLLFAAVNLARFLDIDPEIALKKANQKFSRRFRDMERRASNSGRALAGVPRAEMEAFWDAAKKSEHPSVESTAGAGSKR